MEPEELLLSLSLGEWGWYCRRGQDETHKGSVWRVVGHQGVGGCNGGTL